MQKGYREVFCEKKMQERGREASGVIVNCKRGRERAVHCSSSCWHAQKALCSLHSAHTHACLLYTQPCAHINTLALHPQHSLLKCNGIDLIEKWRERRRIQSLARHTKRGWRENTWEWSGSAYPSSSSFSIIFSTSEWLKLVSSTLSVSNWLVMGN